MLDTLQKTMLIPLDNKKSDKNMPEYALFEETDVLDEMSFFDTSSATDSKQTNRKTEEKRLDFELSQDLFTLIDSFNLDGQMQTFGNSDLDTFQSVINDVIDAAPSGDEFNFLDNVCGFSMVDVPVKNNSCSVTGTACVYTSAAEKDRCANHTTCAHTSSATLCNYNNSCDRVDSLTAADNELLEKLPGFLENIDSVITSKSNSNSKRSREADPQDSESKKKIRLENSHFNENDNDKLSREYTCARGS